MENEWRGRQAPVPHVDTLWSAWQTGHPFRTNAWPPLPALERTPIRIPELSQKRVVAVVPVQDEELTVGAVLGQLARLPLTEIVVVANGCTDRSPEIARRMGCRVLEIKDSLGHDVGRALGVQAVTAADVYLFTDADIVCPAEDFVPYLRSIAQGLDVALNDTTGGLAIQHRLHVVNIAKTFLNAALDRPDLGTSSLTSVPHALSGKAVERIGSRYLAVPPVAHARAILDGLNVRAVHRVDVTTRNRVHPYSSSSRAPQVLEQLIIGDHLEALDLVLRRRGRRGGHDDVLRQRQALRKI